jgi:hypothetical protein
MKHSRILIKIMSVSLARQGKALVRGIFTGACSSEKEIVE